LFRANTDIRFICDLIDIRAHARVHPTILIRLLLPLYPSLAHSRAMYARTLMCAFVFARMCSLCYDRIRTQCETMSSGVRGWQSKNCAPQMPCQKHNPQKYLSPKTARSRCFFIMMHQMIGGREGAVVGEFMQTICASPWNTGFTLTSRHLSYYERRVGC
jgi:hypothetical protein